MCCPVSLCTGICAVLCPTDSPLLGGANLDRIQYSVSTDTAYYSIWENTECTAGPLLCPSLLACCVVFTCLCSSYTACYGGALSVITRLPPFRPQWPSGAGAADVLCALGGGGERGDGACVIGETSYYLFKKLREGQSDADESQRKKRPKHSANISYAARKTHSWWIHTRQDFRTLKRFTRATYKREVWQCLSALICAPYFTFWEKRWPPSIAPCFAALCSPGWDWDRMLMKHVFPSVFSPAGH